MRASFLYSITYHQCTNKFKFVQNFSLLSIILTSSNKDSKFFGLEVNFSLCLYAKKQIISSIIFSIYSNLWHKTCTTYKVSSAYNVQSYNKTKHDR